MRIEIEIGSRLEKVLNEVNSLIGRGYQNAGDEMASVLNEFGINITEIVKHTYHCGVDVAEGTDETVTHFVKVNPDYADKLIIEVEVKKEV